MRPVSLLFLCVFFAGFAPADDWFARGHGRAPHGNFVHICHGYTCRIVTPVSFNDAEMARIAGPLAAAADAAEERAAVSKAVQAFETIVGARIGTAGDLPGMQFGQAEDGQMDCIDEATNTTSLLLMLQDHGYLKFHRVEHPSARGFFVDGRYPHATAVLTDLTAGKKWAIDSWPRANALPPVIMPLADWKRSRVGALHS